MNSLLRNYKAFLILRWQWSKWWLLFNVFWFLYPVIKLRSGEVRLKCIRNVILIIDCDWAGKQLRNIRITMLCFSSTAVLNFVFAESSRICHESNLFWIVPSRQVPMDPNSKKPEGADVFSVCPSVTLRTMLGQAWPQLCWTAITTPYLTCLSNVPIPSGESWGRARC